MIWILLFQMYGCPFCILTHCVNSQECQNSTYITQISVSALCYVTSFRFGQMTSSLKQVCTGKKRRFQNHKVGRQWLKQ